MSQITIYLPDSIEDKARKAAESHGKSVSRWIAEQVLLHLSDVWPRGVLDAAGALQDFPNLEEIRPDPGKDASLESLG